MIQLCSTRAPPAQSSLITLTCAALRGVCSSSGWRLHQSTRSVIGRLQAPFWSLRRVRCPHGRSETLQLGAWARETGCVTALGLWGKELGRLRSTSVVPRQALPSYPPLTAARRSVVKSRQDGEVRAVAAASSRAAAAAPAGARTHAAADAQPPRPRPALPAAAQRPAAGAGAAPGPGLCSREPLGVSQPAA